MDFPHLQDTRFPDIETVNVYDYRNEFDYSRFDGAQMHITLCRVPWDMGEVHIGQRVIGGIGNVVHFGTAKARDEWFDAIPDSDCLRFSTKYRALHRDNMIDLPLTFEVASLYNYIAVEYVIPPNPDNPVEYAEGIGVRKWFWFVREVEFRAVNTTRLHILPDTWQTFIYDVHITQMMLERGHAPMFETKAGYYLGAPASRSANLLAEDVNFGDEPRISRATSRVVLNTADNLQAVIVTSTAITGDWGTKDDGDWTIPNHNQTLRLGVPNYRAYAIAAGNLSSALGNISLTAPQFMQTIKCVFFIRGALLSLGGTAIEFCGSTFHEVMDNGYVADTLYQIAKGDFGYPAPYADIAKLYTWPYACIKVYSEAGDVTDIRIEDTNGTLQLETCLNLAFPYVTIDAHLRGIGGASAASIAFQNATPESIPIGGNWYEFLRTWEVPTFAITQSAHKHYDYAEYYKREQMRLERDNRRENARASADTVKTNADLNADAGKSNADASADTGKTNADASADADYDNTTASANTINSNAALQVTANNAITTAGISKMNSDAAQTQSYNTSSANLAITNTGDMATSQITAANQQAAISAGLTTAQGGLSALGSLASGDAGGALQSGIGAMFSAASTIASATVGVGLTQANAIYHAAYTGSMASLANTDTSVKNTNAVNYATSQRDANNALISDSASNTASTMSANAGRTYNAATDNATRNQSTTKANATRTRDAIKTAATNSRATDYANAGRNYDVDSGRISELIYSRRLEAPKEYGQVSDAAHAMTRPIAMFATVATQNFAHILAAGDEFLRFGYYLNRRWNFEKWHYGKYFTYWKLQDFWVRANDVPDLYMDRLRMFFLEGVTIWRRPEDIGAVNIYMNFNEE